MPKQLLHQDTLYFHKGFNCLARQKVQNKNFIPTFLEHINE